MYKLSFIGAIVLFLFIGCMQKESKLKNTYPQNNQISNIHGKPVNDSVRFLPLYIFTDSGQVYTGVDSTIRLRPNKFFTILNQPILYNYYLGHDIYRFIGSNSFRRNFVLTLHLEKPESHIDLFTIGEGKTDDGITLSLQETKQIDSTYFFLTYKPISIDENFCKKFEELIDSSGFWNLKPYDSYFGLDGSRWLVEAHLRHKYWFHSEWSPKGDFRKVGDFLLDKIYSRR
jgi:hypothetical protein